MVAITATNSTTLSLQASVTKSRLEQARREAAQAEDSAQALHAQAQEQDRIADQARQRERALAEKAHAAATVSPVSAVNTPAAPLSKAPKTAGQRGASYLETLNSVLEAPNPLVASAYELPAQRNIVISSLFQKANQVWQATPPDARVAKLYAGQGSASAGPGGGSLLRTKA